MLARLCWWIIFWPVGLALSIRAGARRRHRQTVAAINAAGRRRCVRC